MIENLPDDTDASAYYKLRDYYYSHDYNQGNYSEYSKDPEWQALNNEYLQEQGKEPIDYSEKDWTDTHVEKIRDELVALGIPENSPELDAIIKNEQQGIDEIINNASIDEPNDEGLLDGVEEIKDESINETVDVPGAETAEIDRISKLMDEDGSNLVDEAVNCLEDTKVVEDLSDNTTDDIESLMDDNCEKVNDVVEETDKIAEETEGEASDVSKIMDEIDVSTEEAPDITYETSEGLSGGTTSDTIDDAHVEDFADGPVEADALENSSQIDAINESFDGENDLSTEDAIVEIAALENLDGWLKDINPNYDAFDIDSPYCNNCGSCAYAVYQRLEGNPDICATAENIGYNSEMEALTGMDQVSMSPQEIEACLLEQGDGAHAIIGIDRSYGPGHWFNAACIDGKVVAIDGQSGEINDWPPDYGDVVNWEMSVKKGE